MTPRTQALRTRALRLREEIVGLMDDRLCARTDRVSNAEEILASAAALLDAEEMADAAMAEEAAA